MIFINPACNMAKSYDHVVKKFKLTWKVLKVVSNNATSMSQTFQVSCNYWAVSCYLYLHIFSICYFYMYSSIACSLNVKAETFKLWRRTNVKPVPTPRQKLFTIPACSGEFRVGGPEARLKRGALWWCHHNQPTVIITFDLPKIQSPKCMFLRLRQNWNSRRKCKRVFMIHNFESTESWEDMAKS